MAGVVQVEVSGRHVERVSRIVTDLEEAWPKVTGARALQAWLLAGMGEVHSWTERDQGGIHVMTESVR